MLPAQVAAEYDMELACEREAKGNALLIVRKIRRQERHRDTPREATGDSLHHSMGRQRLDKAVGFRSRQAQRNAQPSRRAEAALRHKKDGALLIGMVRWFRPRNSYQQGALSRSPTTTLVTRCSANLDGKEVRSAGQKRERSQGSWFLSRLMCVEGVRGSECDRI